MSEITYTPPPADRGAFTSLLQYRGQVSSALSPTAAKHQAGWRMTWRHTRNLSPIGGRPLHD